jgi:hypothetical protein
VLIGERVDFDLDARRYRALRSTQRDLLGDIDAMVGASRHAEHSPYGIDALTFTADPPPFDVNDSKVAINHHLKRANKNYFGSNCDTKRQIARGDVVVQRHGAGRYRLGGS